jgi:hypothetical protein
MNIGIINMRDYIHICQNMHQSKPHVRSAVFGKVLAAAIAQCVLRIGCPC